MKTKSQMKIAIVCVGTLFLLSCTGEKNDTTFVESAIQEISRPDLRGMIGKDFLIDDQHSYIGFRIKYFGNSNVRGRFDKFKGTAFYDPKTNFISTTVIIDPTSINTGDKRRDDDLKQGAWFETSKYPIATFTSAGTSMSPNGLELKGVLKIKDVSKEVVFQLNLPGQITKDWAGNDQLDFTGELKINRREFGIEGEGFWNEVMENGITQLSDEVLLEIEIHARRADYGARKNNPDLMDSLAITLLDELTLNGLEKVTSIIEDSNSSERNRIDRSTLYDLGNALLSEGNSKDALQIFTTLNQRYPEKPGDLNFVGICNLLNHNWREAKQNFEKVLIQDSLNTRAWEYLRNIE
jgi:polyisoprenoid-binding protein YceI